MDNLLKMTHNKVKAQTLQAIFLRMNRTIFSGTYFSPEDSETSDKLSRRGLVQFSAGSIAVDSR